MSSFTQPLTVTKVGNRLWEIDRSFRYYVGKEDSDFYIDIPKGFMTDFASVPRIFWIIFPPDGKYTQAAVVHDFLYLKQHLDSRKEADDIFLEAMKVLEVPKFKRMAIYTAVRLFGPRWGK